jgi:hypothetical protein
MAVTATAGLLDPTERFVAAIARRNILWVEYQDARRAWLAAGRPTGPLLGAMNNAQQVFEHAARELVRARVFLQTETEPVRCSAITRHVAGTHGLMPVACDASIGIRSYLDRSGVKRAYCDPHREDVLERWPAGEREAVTA